jgi:hypothetical protein
LVQGRIYPQGTDGSTDIYKIYREIVQKVVTDCLGVPNMWKNKKGTSECNRVIVTRGVHYADYSNFDDCNVSFLKGENGEIHLDEYMEVGHNPICPHCGEDHIHSGNLEHDHCYKGMEQCPRCGRWHYAGYFHEVNGELICEDCCFYCHEHNEWEDGEHFRVRDFGLVCADALEENENIAVCDDCGEYYLVSEGITTANGKHYCCRRCAVRSNYYQVDGEWYSSDELRQCSECGRIYVNTENSEGELCPECAERRGN